MRDPGDTDILDEDDLFLDPGFLPDEEEALEPSIDDLEELIDGGSRPDGPEAA